MAAKKKDLSYTEYEQELNRQIREQDFRHCTLICGEEDYLRTRNTTLLRNAILGSGDPMNMNVFHGSDTDVNEVLSLAETLPFFAERRVIVLEETGFFSGGKNKAGSETDSGEGSESSTAGQEKLAAAMSSIPDTTYFIFKESAVNGSTKLYKAVKKYGWIMKCDTPDPGYLRRFVHDCMRSFGMPLTAGAVNVLLSYTGDNMLNIRNECAKLADYCLGKQQATEEDVRAICCVTIKDRVFEMITAIVSGNQQLALQIYMELQVLQTPPQLILALMIRQFNLLLQTGELQAQGKSSVEIADLLHQNRWVLENRILPLVRGKKGYKLQQALQSCVQANMQYRRGKIDAGIATEELIIRWSAAGAL